jgi:hypothetical protein
MAERPNRFRALDYREHFKPTARARSLAQPGLDRLAHLQAPQVSLEQARQHLAALQQYKQTVPPAPPRQRVLLERPGVADLYGIVQDLKQDIQFIKDAQSRPGAERWIRNKKLTDHLHVTDDDIDGDGVPDIIVRKRSDNSPYIVKGYTTKPSEYPMRHFYFNQYPTARDRKGHPMRDWYESAETASYTDKGFTRVLRPDFLDIAKRTNAVGYNTKVPKPKLSVVQVFKRFLFKPAMRAVKGIIKQFNNQVDDKNQVLHFNLPAQTARQIETTIRTTLITVPVMQKLYGEEVMELSDDEFQKLTMRREAKDGFKDHLSFFNENRIDLIPQLIDYLLELLIVFGVVEDRIAQLRDHLIDYIENDFQYVTPIHDVRTTHGPAPAAGPVEPVEQVEE